MKHTKRFLRAKRYLAGLKPRPKPYRAYFLDRSGVWEYDGRGLPHKISRELE